MQDGPKSWNKMILSHINRDVNVYQDGNIIVQDARVINIDLVNGRIILRKDRGEGVQVTIFGGSIVIEDVENYKPGYTEYNRMNSPESY